MLSKNIYFHITHEYAAILFIVLMVVYILKKLIVGYSLEKKNAYCSQSAVVFMNVNV